MQNTKGSKKHPNNIDFADLAGKYLLKHGYYPALIDHEPDKELQMVVVIPATNESGLISSLDSLFQCDPPSGSVELIVVINSSETTDKEILLQNKKTLEEVNAFAETKNSTSCMIHALLLTDMPDKTAGVGMARKVGMDEAIRRFALNNKEGLILSLDADCRVDSDYFTEIEKHFIDHQGSSGCSIYFEHPLEGNEYDHDVYRAIRFYELHQRYYLQGLRYANHPNCYHTVGSAFAVKAGYYCKEGGMNKRKAGEDFYFLQKFFDLGNFSECNETRIIPSPRPSDRVPFGTGPAVSEFLKTGKELHTFNPELFTILKKFIALIPSFYESDNEKVFSLLSMTDNRLYQFLDQNNFNKRLKEIKINSSTKTNFIKRFYTWFNMFRMLKFLNFAKEDYPDEKVTKAAKDLLKYKGHQGIPDEARNLLEIYRKMERTNPLQ